MTITITHTHEDGTLIEGSRNSASDMAAILADPQRAIELA